MGASSNIWSTTWLTPNWIFCAALWLCVLKLATTLAAALQATAMGLGLVSKVQAFTQAHMRQLTGSLLSHTSSHYVADRFTTISCRPCLHVPAFKCRSGIYTLVVTPSSPYQHHTLCRTTGRRMLLLLKNAIQTDLAWEHCIALLYSIINNNCNLYLFYELWAAKGTCWL